MAVKEQKFADKTIQGVAIEPKCRAHYGVIELLDRNRAAVIEEPESQHLKLR